MRGRQAPVGGSAVVELVAIDARRQIHAVVRKKGWRQRERMRRTRDGGGSDGDQARCRHQDILSVWTLANACHDTPGTSLYCGRSSRGLYALSSGVLPVDVREAWILFRLVVGARTLRSNDVVRSSVLIRRLLAQIFT